MLVVQVAADTEKSKNNERRFPILPSAHMKSIRSRRIYTAPSGHGSVRHSYSPRYQNRDQRERF
jgi:hypothetical protein